MGLILDIVNRVVPRTMDRISNEGGMLKEILAEELEREIGHSLPDQSIGNEPEKNFNDIVTDDENINNEIMLIGVDLASTGDLTAYAIFDIDRGIVEITDSEEQWEIFRESLGISIDSIKLGADKYVRCKMD